LNPFSAGIFKHSFLGKADCEEFADLDREEQELQAWLDANPIK